MKYKVLTLILLIPLVLMVCVFSAANFTSLQVPIPVESISIYHDRLEVLNLAENKQFQINAQVKPINASNKGLIYTIEKVSGKELPTISISENGLVTASGYGTAKIVVTTKDGAYKKSFLLEVTSTIASELIAHLSTTEQIFVGDTFSLLTSVLPDAALDKNVKFTSTNANVVRIDSITGECEAISSGKATIKAVLENGLTGKLEKTFDIVVLPNNSSNPITFDGKLNFEDNIFAEDCDIIMEVNFTDLHQIGFNLELEDIDLKYNQEDVEEVNLVLDQNATANGIYKYNVQIRGVKVEQFNLSASLKYENYSTYTSRIILNKIVDLNDLQVSLTNFREYIKLDEQRNFKVAVLPNDFVDYSINAYFENARSTLVKNGDIYTYVGKEIGVNNLNVEISYAGEVIKTITKSVEVLPTKLEFALDSAEYGIEELLTVGNEKIVNGLYETKTTSFNLVTNGDLNNIQFVSLNEGIAKFEDGELVILNEGRVTIKAFDTRSNLFGVDLSSDIEIRCVKGVEVGTYQELVQATEDGKQVVLTNSIMLGEKLVEVGADGKTTLLKSEAECAQILASEVKQIATSGEWNYYKHSPDHKLTNPPTINYIIKFTNNIYGNGYFLNANNISNLVDATNSPRSFAPFKGPLDLVAIPDAAAKAQDNICFIASDNVMINNVELIGATLGGLDSVDLSRLNYVGTVLEVMGDNVKIVNSKIKNGRNCLRVYGKESGNYDKINVLIESCEISYAREFLIKMGTNAKLYGQFDEGASIDLSKGNLDPTIWEKCAPKIENLQHLNDGSLTQEQYSNLVAKYKEDEIFQSLVKTNLTIKNCILHTSGLFSIGLESSFAGPALDGGRYGDNWNFANYGWVDIAGTSYPTMLNLEGDVKIYDWKKLSHVDTSILLDGDMFNLDLAGMIEKLYNDGKFTDIITEVKIGSSYEKFTHGGIVMYGGGKNYALVNNNTNDHDDLVNYTINLDSLNSSLASMFKYASGKEEFRVFMYGKNSDLNYYQQTIDLETGDAYNYLGKYYF